jgi:hypothetical protein
MPNLAGRSVEREQWKRGHQPVSCARNSLIDRVKGCAGDIAAGRLQGFRHILFLALLILLHCTPKQIGSRSLWLASTL